MSPAHNSSSKVEIFVTSDVLDSGSVAGGSLNTNMYFLAPQCASPIPHGRGGGGLGGD